MGKFDDQAVVIDVPFRCGTLAKMPFVACWQFWFLPRGEKGGLLLRGAIACTINAIVKPFSAGSNVRFVTSWHFLAAAKRVVPRKET